MLQLSATYFYFLSSLFLCFNIHHLSLSGVIYFLSYFLISLFCFLFSPCSSVLFYFLLSSLVLLLRLFFLQTSLWFYFSIIIVQYCPNRMPSPPLCYELTSTLIVTIPMDCCTLSPTHTHTTKSYASPYPTPNTERLQRQHLFYGN